MALTLAEAAKLSNDVLLMGVIETIIYDSPVLQVLPFIEIVGNGLTYNQENQAPTVAFYDVGDTWAESTPTFTQQTATLKILGGDADVDNFLAKTRSNIQDLEAAVVQLKAKAVQQKFDDTFINGDTSSDAKSFNGIDKLCVSGQTLSMGADGGTLTLEKLDELVDKIKGGKPDMLLMSKRSRRKLTALSRGSGSGIMEFDRNQFGQMVQYYSGIPPWHQRLDSRQQDRRCIYRLLHYLLPQIRRGLGGGSDRSRRPSGRKGRQPGDKGCHPHQSQVVCSAGPVQHPEAGQTHRRPQLGHCKNVGARCTVPLHSRGQEEAMNLNDMRARIRKDLHDEDSQNYRWTDSDLNRHIDHALRELSLSCPLEAKATLSTTAESRDLSLSSLSDLVEIEAVEYPAGNYPPSYVRFSVWADTLSLLIDSLPGDSEDVYVYYGKLHTLNADTSTLPAKPEDLLALGAVAYAAIEWASFATNRVNLGGAETWRNYLTWGQDRLAAFMKGLAKHSKKNTVRVRQLYPVS